LDVFLNDKCKDVRHLVDAAWLLKDSRRSFLIR
jgi:hypothetical protein